MYCVNEYGVLKTVECWSVVVPLVDNEGNHFDRTVIDSILNEILLNYPGFSVASCVGYWKGSDRVYVDQNYQVLIDAVPDDSADSLSFFAALKTELQTKLNQEKIYVMRQESKEELLSFDEFFKEIGVEANSEDAKAEAKQLAKELVDRIDFILQRLGYETVLLRRDSARKKIIWERKICGIKLRSEFDDSLPDDVTVVAADQVAELGEALAGEKPFAVVGSYESQFHVLTRSRRRSLVVANLGTDTYANPYCFSPAGEPLNVKQFIEEFTMSVFTNCIVLRDEGFLTDEIKVTVGSDGSIQWTVSPRKNFLLHSPATIPDAQVQLEIIRCLKAALGLYETNASDSIAVLQAKAKNNYFLKRAIVRHTLRSASSDLPTQD